MGNTCFPQLTSGALAQYPIQKVSVTSTVKNILADRSMIVRADPGGSRRIWHLTYTDLSTIDLNALQTHFAASGGSFHGFTFIDPTDNMLVSSSDLTAPAWQTSNLIRLSVGLADPNGGSEAFTATNTGEVNQEIIQTLAVPANYQYCSSLYVTSNGPSELTLALRGTSAERSTAFTVSAGWKRVVVGARLNDAGMSLTLAIGLMPGQQIGLYGPQLEAQLLPSRYRPTAQRGGVYANAHWGTDELAVVAEAPNLYSASFSIESGM